MSTCAVCCKRMIPTGFDHHPSCGPDGHLYRVEFPSGKAAAIQAVSAARPDLVAKGVAIIRTAAEQHPFVSANTCRSDLALAGIVGPMVGAVFNHAAKKKYIEREGFVPSTQGVTHGHHIARWRSRVYQGRVA